MMFFSNKFYSPVDTGSNQDQKKLIVVRHAKSSWDISDINDFDRPLNERGKKDAPDMAKRLLKTHLKVDAFISSSAKRAVKTAALFCDVFEKNDSDIIVMPELYHAPAELIFEIVKNFDDKFQTVVVFTHNPGITDFVNRLVKNIRLDNMPTCGMFGVTANISSWTNFETAEKKLWIFDYPKAGIHD